MILSDLKSLSHQGCVLTKLENGVERSIVSYNDGISSDVMRSSRTPCYFTHFEHAQSTGRGSAFCYMRGKVFNSTPRAPKVHSCDAHIHSMDSGLEVDNACTDY